ncbi:MAG: fibronectin type III domain-containing protein, partial [Acidimicrobiia bacterium]
MSRSLARRARVRLRTLAAGFTLLTLWWGGSPPVSADGRDHGRDRSSDSVSGPGCGGTWADPEHIDTLHGNLLEVSGFVSSARYPGVAWMIRDSGGPASLYSFQLDGNTAVWKEFAIAGDATNHDWEDVTYTIGPDGRGHLWILENDFTGYVAPDGTAVTESVMRIYEVLEPDPSSDGPAQLVGTYEFVYPGEKQNTEAIFALAGKLFVVSKTDPNRVYKLPWPLSPSGVNQLVDAGSFDDAGVKLTAAAVSGDDELIVTMSMGHALNVFRNRSGAGEFSAFSDRDPTFHQRMSPSQRESVDFFPYSGCDLISVSEDGTVWRLANPRTVHPASQPGPPGGVSAAPGDGTATVHWVAPAVTGGSGITGYIVSAYEGPTEVSSVTVEDGTATSAVVTGLTDGVTYTFTVRAINGTGQGTASSPSLPITPGPASSDPTRTPASAPGASGSGRTGYWMLGSAGAVYAFGEAPNVGEAVTALGGAAAVDLEPTPSGLGYWVVDDRGRVHPFGDARSYGNVDATRLVAGESVTSLSATPAGDGYRIFTSRGRVLPFGGATFAGDVSAITLNGPVLDSVTTPSGLGYYMVASDGGIFTFGDATFLGSMGGKKLNAPVQSLVPDGDGSGYWLVASDGGIFAFEAPFKGSMGNVRLNKPVTGMVRFGNGYLMVGEDGGIFNFSDKQFHGSLGDRPPA